MNKTHWNTVYMDGSLTYKQLCGLIDHAYELILKSLPKTLRDEIAAANR
jgi:predicted DNA-binding protein (MmcQ/YjbR family)